MPPEDLIEQYARDLRGAFPSVRTASARPDADDPESYLLYVEVPTDEDERIRFHLKASALSTRYLDEHGILITPVSGSFDPAPSSSS